MKEQILQKIKGIQGDVGICVKFLNSGKTIEHNPNKQFWAASVIKIPIICELYRQAEKNILV